MHWWRRHLADLALCVSCAATCAGCAAPYPPVPHRELEDRILPPPEYSSYGEAQGAEELARPMPSEAAMNRARKQITVNADQSAVLRATYNRAASQEKDEGLPPLSARRLALSQADALAAPLDPPSGATDAQLPPAELVRGAAIELPPAECTPLTLAAAIDLAYRSSPALDQARARVEMAKAGKDIAYADFLPELVMGYRHLAGGTHPGGYTVPTVASITGNVAFGMQAEEFDLAELRAQWTVWDFGRTTSRFGQSLIAQEIAGLQYVRSQQTVSFDVASAYFEALAARAAADVAEESVRRAQSVLDDAKNYLHRGNAIRNDVLRAEVFVKEMQLDLVKAHTSTGVAVAKLNRAIGINPSCNTRIETLADAPPFEEPLQQCLQMAVENRREFGVVERGIATAKLGENVAVAEFKPKVVVGALGALQQEHDPTLYSQHGSVGVGIELGLYQGGRRVAEVHRTSAEVELALASAKQVCDQIAYEVNVAHLTITDAKERIRVQRAAAAQASENLRVVKSLYDQGDAIPTDVIDAELTLTRAQQGYLIATYDYQTALARLAYAVGLPPESFLAAPARR